MTISWQNKSSRPALVSKIVTIYKSDMVRFDAMLKDYPRYYYDSSFEVRLRKFEDITRQLKRIEGLFTYFHPKLAYETFLVPARFEARDFGPPFPDNWLIAGPFGIEPDSIMVKRGKKDSVFARRFIERSVTNFRKVIAECNYEKDCEAMTESAIMEALKLQLIRISTIGISNGDFVIEQAGMPALEGEFSAWSDLVKLFVDELAPSQKVLKSNILSKLSGGQKMLDEKPHIHKFDRMAFLTGYLNPLAHHLSELQVALSIKTEPRFSAIIDGRNIYDADAFNANFFAPGKEGYISKEKAELGKLLFFDPILSDNNERACASCHKPEKAFTDGNIKSLDFKRGDLPRNAPTVINSAFQKLQFWDLRATSLEDQLDSVINSEDELHSNFENVIERINSSPEYVQMFHVAFPESKTKGIQRDHVKFAIAVYERVLTGMNTRFDEYVRGDRAKMNASEVNGFNIFMGKAKCASCHYAPLFNGALPPYFEFTDHRAIGVPLKDTMAVYQVDPDTGASKVSKNPFVHFSFKVPTVRNVELTAPYMHNGVYKTLEQVVEFYNDAGGNKFTKDMRPGMKGLPFFMILPEKLNLTDPEKKDLVAFMKALTDNSASKNIPSRLPTITGKYAKLDKRKLGGEY